MNWGTVELRREVEFIFFVRPERGMLMFAAALVIRPPLLSNRFQFLGAFHLMIDFVIARGDVLFHFTRLADFAVFGGRLLPLYLRALQY